TAACTLLRVPLRFMSTPKDSRDRLRALAALPQFSLVAALACACAVPARSPILALAALALILGNWLLAAVCLRDLAGRSV
ncbi:MAG: hypothetical protein PHU21_05510, partial [Elusimicrobia bacterium]|nr:hypothetical protein [Elusimicrobiota bacterium]